MKATKNVVSTWTSTLQSCTGHSIAGIKERRMASLWAGYGSVVGLEVSLQQADEQGRKTLHLVAKQVRPPGSSGVSHERKIRSYEAEGVFYTSVAPQLLQHTDCAVPQPVHLEIQPPGSFTFVLSDLSHDFPEQHHSYSLQEAQAALDWLASLHAFHWEQALPEGLWHQGCYWHLDTRQEELQQIGRDWQQLKDAAAAIDCAMRGMDPDANGGSSKAGSSSSSSSSAGHAFPFRTLVHGDFKSANVLFSADGSRVGVYDFQYCGAGLGASDIAYLFCSSLDEDVLRQHEQELLQYYHSRLQRYLQQYGRAGGERYSLQVLQRHYELALLDYCRFMAGWGWWGNAGWARARAKELLRGGLQRLLKA